MTKLTQPIVINAPEKDIVFDGVDFTDKATIVVTAAKSLTIKNSRIYGINVDNSVRFWLRINGEIPLKLIIERNFFGNNTGIYNFIEPNAKLESGSSVSKNYAKKGCCTHNIFSIYNAMDNAEIHVDKNYFEYSNGGIRLGTKGDVPCKIIMNENVIKEGDKEYPEWDGLLCIQPYGKQTTSFAKCTVCMNKNKIAFEQIVYAYSGANDTEMTKDTIPTVYVDGKKIEDYPILH